MAWPLPMLGAWLCAPNPFLTVFYKGLKKKKIQAKCFEKGRTLETVQNTVNTLCLLWRWREKGEVARCLRGKLTVFILVCVTLVSKSGYSTKEPKHTPGSLQKCAGAMLSSLAGDPGCSGVDMQDNGKSKGHS